MMCLPALPNAPQIRHDEYPPHHRTRQDAHRLDRHRRDGLQHVRPSLGRRLFRHCVSTARQAKAQRLLDRGARWADSPKAVAEASDVIFTMVGYPADVREVILGPSGVLAGCTAGQDHRGHDHQPAVAGPRDRRGGRGAGRPGHRRPGLRRRRRRPRGPALDHGRRRPRGGRGPDAVLPGHGQDHRPPGRSRGRAAHQAGQPGNHRRHDDRHLRGPALRLSRRAGPEPRVGVDRVRGGREAGRLRTLPRGSSTTASSPGSSSSTSSRTWALPWRNRSGWGLPCRDWLWPSQLYLSLAAQGHGRDGTHALELALASMSAIDWKNRD